jgi:hypothetical protein
MGVQVSEWVVGEKIKVELYNFLCFITQIMFISKICNFNLKYFYYECVY